MLFPTWENLLPKLLLVFSAILFIKAVEGNLLKCSAGHAVSFDCPCCPEEFDECRFKKLFQGGYILRDGILMQPSKYKLNEHKTHITLKECHEDDEGTYVWMCGRCNVNRQFHLEVSIWLRTSESLSCIAGGDFSFECPCCPTELDDCTFKKHGHDKYIARRGFLNLNTKYEFNENKTHITLKRCDESDGGTYAWICGNCNDKHFDLNVHKGEFSAIESRSSKMAPWIPVIFQISLVTLAMAGRHDTSNMYFVISDFFFCIF